MILDPFMEGEKILCRNSGSGTARGVLSLGRAKFGLVGENHRRQFRLREIGSKGLCTQTEVVCVKILGAIDFPIGKGRFLCVGKESV